MSRSHQAWRVLLQTGAGPWQLDPRLPELGLRAVLPKAVGEPPSPSSAAAVDDWRDYRRWRFQQGVAEGDGEIPTGAARDPGCLGLHLTPARRQGGDVACTEQQGSMLTRGMAKWGSTDGFEAQASSRGQRSTSRWMKPLQRVLQSRWCSLRLRKPKDRMGPRPHAKMLERAVIA